VRRRAIQDHGAAVCAVRRDLLEDEPDYVFRADRSRLESLARDQLSPIVEEVRVERSRGCVDVMRLAAYADLLQFKRTVNKRRQEPTKSYEVGAP